MILTGAATRADGSLGLRFVTPELAADEKVVLMELQNRNLKMLLTPVDDEPAEMKEVKGQFDHKSPSQRMRACLFLLWKHNAHEQGEFEDFYRRWMHRMIESIKDQLPEQQG